MTGETNTDDLSPAPDAWSRPDIPLHALAMLKIPREGITDAQKQMEDLKKKVRRRPHPTCVAQRCTAVHKLRIVTFGISGDFGS